jgi:hypothetical protein
MSSLVFWLKFHTSSWTELNTRFRHICKSHLLKHQIKCYFLGKRYCSNSFVYLNHVYFSGLEIQPLCKNKTKQTPPPHPPPPHETFLSAELSGWLALGLCSYSFRTCRWEWGGNHSDQLINANWSSSILVKGKNLQCDSSLKRSCFLWYKGEKASCLYLVGCKQRRANYDLMCA